MCKDGVATNNAIFTALERISRHLIETKQSSQVKTLPYIGEKW